MVSIFFCRNEIPIFIRNTFEPEHPGTRIFKAPQKGQVAREKCVCGFSTFDNVALLNLEGTGMIGIRLNQIHIQIFLNDFTF